MSSPSPIKTARKRSSRISIPPAIGCRQTTIRQITSLPGEVAFAYGSAVSEGMQDLFPASYSKRYGVRINPYLFAGVGLGINYFYKDIYFSNGWNIYELGNSGTVLPVFANVKGYLPVSRKAALNLSWDLGACNRYRRLLQRGHRILHIHRPRRHVRPSERRGARRFQHPLPAHGRRIECHPIPHRNRILKYVRQIFKHGTSRLFEIIGESKPKRLSATGRQPLHIIPTFHRPWEQQDLQVFDLFFRSFAGESFPGRISSDTKHSKNTGSIGKRIMPLSSSAATDCASSERIRTCTRSSETSY